ncbi:asparagine synthase (glutamine-hydrolyzing) [Parvularcula sp. LCG005]|uniref:asparagine synthase (glutamine-hydrolyzing) n=1 Tax=Parvularcula sp. LCG005 TaxID=3078805 RepID=UPI002941E0D3|nr:asparagine synthase (glutamine-hydrolyzing) [Parvularcula sp. LCG005]WOI52045.1 asparagine synthase (glutamine-hydrolyzing) [Parvularcula sp. LCG005]
MCGIAGIIDIRGTREINRDALVRMADALAHRGPDGHGYHIEPGVGLAHRRLAIIDIEGGHQPFISSTGKTVVTFNGEIYNYRDLMLEVRQKSRVLKTRSDTEVLAELVDMRGADALPSLNGMFAFGAWSPRDQTFLLARDRLGEKPLYYAITADGFLLFASEIAGILASNLVADLIDETAVSDYMMYGYVPDPKTIYRGIAKLPPGHSITYRRGRPLPAPQSWWSLSMRPDETMTFEEAEAAVLPLLDRVVQDQMVSDVPIAAFLSGGVDSSAIVSAMTRGGEGEVTTCAMGFDDPSFDERSPARRVAAHLGTQHKEELADVNATDLIPTIAQVYGEPFADTSALPTFMLCKLARHHATVALSGDGGDEVFAGYNRYQGVLREARLRRVLPATARSNLVARAGRMYPSLPNAPSPLRLKTALQAVGETQAAGYARAVSAVLPDRCEALLSADLNHYRAQSIVEDVISRSGTDDPVLQAQAADFATWLPGRMLVKVDRAAMANGLEVRPPLLDYRLVEWAARLPRQFKVKGNTGKRIFKTALEDRLPDDILYRAKQGFGAPVDHWFRDEGGALLDRVRTADRWKESGFFNVDEVLATASRMAEGRGRHGQELWSILMFDAFLSRGEAAA